MVSSQQGSKNFLRLIRRRVRRCNQMARYRRISLSDVPILFANSFPKSGTHLLTQVLIGFTRFGPVVDSGLPAIVTFEGTTGKARTEEQIFSDIQRLLPGDIAYGHVHAIPEIVNYVLQNKFATYFIIRDPRDVVVSHVHYITEMEPRHIHHQYYNIDLDNFDDRLRTSILGIQNNTPSSAASPMETETSSSIPEGMPNIYQRFEPYLGWLNHPNILTLHFEDFIRNIDQTLLIIFDHAVQLGFKPKYKQETSIAILKDCIDPERSPTFRHGKVGGWRAAFNQTHKSDFKLISGDLLMRLGYEKDNNW